MYELSGMRSSSNQTEYIHTHTWGTYVLSFDVYYSRINEIAWLNILYVTKTFTLISLVNWNEFLFLQSAYIFNACACCLTLWNQFETKNNYSVWKVNFKDCNNLSIKNITSHTIPLSFSVLQGYAKSEWCLMNQRLPM